MVLKLITKSERLLSAQNVRPFFISKRDKGTPKEMKRPMKQLFFKAILRNEMAKQGPKEKDRHRGASFPTPCQRCHTDLF